MTNYRAKHKHWAEVEEYAKVSENAWDSCIFELLSRVEDLEVINKELRIKVLRVCNND